MPWDHRDFYKELNGAVEGNDRTRVSVLSSALVRHLRSRSSPYDKDDALIVLRRLRRRRYFTELRRVADALVSNGCDHFEVRRRYAQALLDLEMLSAAEHVLERLVRETQEVSQDANRGLEARQEAKKENAEARGLMGRLYKQRYIDADSPEVDRNQAALRQAILAYYDCYAESESSREWHGVNAVALAWRARADKVRRAVNFDSHDVAAQILASSEGKLDTGGGDLWAAANAMEACLALERYDDALAHAKRYISRGNNADAFEIAGTLRNLREVWRLPRNGKGAELLTLLDARLRELEGFEVEVTPRTQLSERALEKVFEGTQVDLERYRKGLMRAAAVARIGPDEWSGIGTGFLVAGEELHKSWVGRKLLLTNDHVVPRGLPEGRAMVTFFGSGEKPPSFRVKERIWNSPKGELDTTILALEGDLTDVPTCPLATQPIEVGPTARVMIIGHPGGGSLHFSLNDNRLLDWKDALLHYRAPTEAGNSGSPVFDMDWGLVAIHHSGSQSMPRLDGDGVYEANEGISIFAIRKAIAAANKRTEARRKRPAAAQSKRPDRAL